jgi:LPS export ABC transporter permease LptG
MAAAGREALSSLLRDVAARAGAAIGPRLTIPGLSLLDRYIGRALVGPVVVIIAALGLLMLLERALVLLSAMAALGMASKFFWPLMVRLVPFYLMQAIPAAFAVSMVLTVQRLTADRELEVMAAAGVSPARMARPMTLVALVIALLTLVVSGWLEPVGRYGYRSMYAFAVSESLIRTLKPREIYAPGDDAMLTVDSIGPEGLGGVFLWLSDGADKESVATAPSGTIATVRKPPSLEFTLDDGVMVGSDRIELDFAELTGSHVLGAAATPRARGRDARELTLSELVRLDADTLTRKQRNQRAGEIYSRLARSFGVLVLPWIMLPLLFTGTDSRKQSWASVALIIVLVVSFYHAVNFARNLVFNGDTDVVSVTAVTLLLPALAVAVIWRSDRWRRILQRKRLPGGTTEEPADKPVAGLGLRSGLSFYLARRLLTMIATVLVAVVLLLQIVDLFESGGALVRNRAGLKGFAVYAWWHLPATLLQAMPIATLGGALLTWARMRATSELFAIKAAGISHLGFLRRALAVPLLVGLAMVAIAEYWSPASEVAFSRWWDKLSALDADTPPDRARWFRFGDDVVRATMASSHGDRLGDIRIFRRDTDGRLRERITADGARWTAGGWRLGKAEVWQVKTTKAEPLVLADYFWTASLTPAEVRRFFAGPMPLSGREAWAAKNNDAPVDRAADLYETRILMTFSVAAAPLVMLLLSVALIIVPTRDRSLAVVLFQALVAGLMFMVLNGYCEVMGLAGELSPWVAVFIAPLLFGWYGTDRLLRADGGRAR